jgi:hypothetical protein
MMLPLIAHAGPGSTWQAAVVVAGVALAICVVLAASGILSMSAPEDLLVPLAASAISASLGPLGHIWISDAIGWGLPLGIVSLMALLLAALTPLELTPTSPLSLGALALAAVTMYLLFTPLTIALHPPPDMLPLADDSEVTIVAPDDGAVLDTGPTVVTVEVTGGSIGPVFTPVEDLSLDPEEAGSLQVFVDGDRQEVAWDEDCTADDPCSRVEIEVDIPAGESQLAIEFVRGDGSPFAPLVVDRVTVTGE